MRAEFLVHLGQHGIKDIHPGGGGASDALIDALRIEPDCSVLEVGCGTGYSLARVLTIESVRATGLDYTPEMLRMAARRLRWAGFADRSMLVRGRAQDLPFASGSFDRAFAESVLGFQDTAVIRRALRELHRILKPGGIFVANDAVWNNRLVPSALPGINAGCLADFGLRQSTEEPWRVDDWLREFRRSGFEVKSATSVTTLRSVSDSRNTCKAPLAATLAIWPHRFRSYLSIAQLRERRRYRRLVEAHVSEAHLTDAILFVVRKPA